QLFGLALPSFTGAVLDHVIGKADEHLLSVLVIASVVVVAFQAVTTLLRSHLLLHLATLLDARMTLQFLHHLVRVPYRFFQQRTAGDLLLRLNSNGTVREVLSTAAVSTLLDGTMIITYTSVLLIAAPRIAALAGGLAVGYALLWTVTARAKRSLAAETI